MPENKTIKLKETSEQTKTRASTLRYYSSLGIIPFDQKEPRLARRYDLEKVSKRLEEIKNLKEKGLTITDIVARFKAR